MDAGTASSSRTPRNSAGSIGRCETSKSAAILAWLVGVTSVSSGTRPPIASKNEGTPAQEVTPSVAAWRAAMRFQ